MSRVLVVGLPCAGKTTLAAQLAHVLGVPHIEVDGHQWGPDWKVREDFVERVTKATDAAGWVADDWGASQVRELLWSRADHLVWLDLPWRQTQRRAVVRTARRLRHRTVDELGNREGWLAWLKPMHPVRYVWREHRPYREEMLTRLSAPEWKGLRVSRLRSDAEVAALLTDITRAAAG